MSEAVDRMRQAEQLAKIYAPRPRHDPTRAASAIAVIAAVAIGLFAAASGIPLGRLSIAWLFIVAGFYLVPWYYLKRQIDAHHAAVFREFQKLKHGE